MIWRVQQEIFDDALTRGQVGLALLDDALVVSRRLGALSGWLPREGAPACDAPLLMHMAADLAALRETGGDILLPSMRTAPDAPRVTISISWNARAGAYMIVTAPDHAGEQIERLLASDRREKQLLRQQADAAAAKLRVADALYRDIVELSGFLTLRFDTDFRLVYANREVARFLGLAQEALIGRAVDDLFPPHHGAANPWRLEAAAERPAAFELAAYNAQGGLRWLGWSVHFLDEEGGGQFQAMARDATASKRLRVEREKAQEEARAAAVANERLRIAHDLHDTLVRSIVTMIAEARLIAKKTSDPEAKAALAGLDAHARQGLWEAREAIAQTRRARREEQDLRAIARDFAARSEGVAVALDFDAAGALPEETERLFAAVLREALRNIELHAAATQVRVALRKEEGGVTLLVEDNGTGFDPAAPAPGHFGVTGMRERAGLAGATLTIESAPGAGTRVRLQAPLLAD